MSETLADLRLLDSHMRETYRRKESVSKGVLRAAEALGIMSEEFVAVAVDLVLAGQTAQALATWELHETAAELADPLGRRLDIDPPVDRMIGAETHNGTPLETVYRRPARVLQEAVLAGAPYALAEAKAKREVVSLVDADMSVAGRRADEIHGKVDLRVVGYRRVPNSGACKWCRYIATQRYKTGNLRDAHEYCNCGTREIFGKRDPGPILNKRELARIKAEGVPKKYGSGATKKANRRLAANAPVAPSPKLSAPTPKLAVPDPPKARRGDYSNAKTTDDVVREWSRAHPESEFVPGGWKVKDARRTAEVMEDLYERFPLADENRIAVWGNIREVYPRKKISRGVQGLAQSQPSVYNRDLGVWEWKPVQRYGDARLGVTTQSVTKGEAMAREGKKIGHWSTDHGDAVLVHEYGHHVGYEAEMTLLRRNMPEGRPAVVKTVAIQGNRDSKEMFAQAVSDRLSREFGDGGPTRFSDWTTTIRTELSDYATTNGREAMAEAFAEVALLGDEARPLSKTIVDLALELIEEGKALRP